MYYEAQAHLDQGCEGDQVSLAVAIPPESVQSDSSAFTFLAAPVVAPPNGQAHINRAVPSLPPPYPHTHSHHHDAHHHRDAAVSLPHAGEWGTIYASSSATAGTDIHAQDRPQENAQHAASSAFSFLEGGGAGDAIGGVVASASSDHPTPSAFAFLGGMEKQQVPAAGSSAFSFVN